MNLSPPDFLVLGHLTCDEQADGSCTLGGAATFAAIAARNLGYRVGILTSAAPDFPRPELLHDIEIIRLPSSTTTTFRNTYSAGKRTQFVRNIASPITAASIPAAWRNAKIVLLGPVAGELDADVARAFSDDTLVAVAPQGWMRQWDETGRVKPCAWVESTDILPHIDALILSDEDLGTYTEHLSSYIVLAPLVALTEGEQGVTIYRQHERPLHVPAFPATPNDPTGAGDSFTTGFLIAYHETHDLLQAARYGNATAALAIESIGAASMPTRAEVESLLAAATT